MTDSLKLKTVSIFIFFFSQFSIVLCLVLSQSFEFRELPEPGNYFGEIKIYKAGDALRDKQSEIWAIPYIDGTTSISRIGRVYPNYLIFKPALILTALFTIYYWFLIKKIFCKINLNKVFLFGFFSSICLILHSIFLGVNIDNNFYKFFVRLNLFLTLIFALTSKMFFINKIKNINKYYSKIINANILNLKSVLFKFLIIVPIISVPLIIIFEYEILKYIVEWNYYLLIYLYYLLTFFLIKSTNI